MPNNRVFYAIHSVAFKDNSAPPTNQVVPIIPGVDVAPSGRWEVARGVQSVGMTTTFNYEQVFQLGQLEIYEFIESEPEIEFTIEKVLDGTKPLWFMVTGPRGSTTLVERTANYKVDVAVPIYSDTQTRATGLPVSMCLGSGMYVSSVTYTFPVDGNFTESITLVGNDKIWADYEGVLGSADAYPLNGSSNDASPVGFPSGDSTPGGFPGGILPFITAGGEDARVIGSGVQRRESFDLSCSRLPTEIPGVNAQGELDGLIEHLQTITVSTDLGREDIFELGKKRPYTRFVTFPIEVTTSIEVITSQGDLIDARSLDTTCVRSDNTSNQHIKLCLCEGLVLDLGNKNRLQSIDVTGGEAGGGNMTITYNYSNFNELTITHRVFT